MDDVHVSNAIGRHVPSSNLQIMRDWVDRDHSTVSTHPPGQQHGGNALMSTTVNNDVPGTYQSIADKPHLWPVLCHVRGSLVPIARVGIGYPNAEALTKDVSLNLVGFEAPLSPSEPDSLEQIVCSNSNTTDDWP